MHDEPATSSFKESFPGVPLVSDEAGGAGAVRVEQPELVFEAGQFVVCVKGRGVVLSDVTIQQRLPLTYRVRLANGAVLDRSATSMVPVTAGQQSMLFPLDRLPIPVLSVVLFWLPINQAGELACVSKRFAGAFRDETA